MTGPTLGPAQLCWRDAECARERHTADDRNQCDDPESDVDVPRAELPKLAALARPSYLIAPHPEAPITDLRTLMQATLGTAYAIKREISPHEAQGVLRDVAKA